MKYLLKKILFELAKKYFFKNYGRKSHVDKRFFKPKKKKGLKYLIKKKFFD